MFHADHRTGVQQRFPVALLCALLCALLSALLVAACQAQTTSITTAADSPAAEAALRQQISAEVGSAACSSSADCRTLPMGSKACGGPASWLAWSARVSRGEELQRWSQDLAQSQRRRNMGQGRMSTCSVVPDPGARCDAGRCVLAQGRTTD